MARKGPSLSPQTYGKPQDFDNLLNAATSDDYDIIPIVPAKRTDLTEEDKQKLAEEDALKMFSPENITFVPLNNPEPTSAPVVEPVQISEPEPVPKLVKATAVDLNKKLNFNEIQEPVVWGSNVFDANKTSEPELEVEPEDNRRIRTTQKPQHEEEQPTRRPRSNPRESMDADAIPAKPKKEAKSKKEKPKKEAKPKKNTKPSRKINAETEEELDKINNQDDEITMDVKSSKKGKKDKKSKTSVKDIPYEELDPKSSRYKKLTKIYQKYPKEYYDPTDKEVDVADGQTYFYFNIEKTLRNKNLLFITKIIPLYKLEDMTFDNPNFDKIAIKQHEKTVKLNALPAEEQYKYEVKKKTTKIGIVVGLILLLGFHITQNVIPENKFEKATEQMVAGNYEDSYFTFTSLGQKYNSYIFAKYDEGQVFLNKAKESSSGTAGKNLTEEEKNALIADAIEKYDSAKECFELLQTSYYQYLQEPLSLDEETAYKHISDLISECDYSKARMLYQNSQFEEAASIFHNIYTYSDSTDNYYRCMYQIADKYYEENDYFLAIDNFYPVAKAKYSDADTRLKELAAQLYDDATAAYKMQDYEKAIEYFAFLSDYNYSDSTDMINKCRYNYALDFYNAKEYSKALNYFSDIEKYKDSLSLKKDCIYRLGVIAYHQNPVTAIQYFDTIPSFKDASDIMTSINLVIFGKWKITEIDGNATQDIEFSFTGDGAFMTSSADIVGVAISTDSTQYKYQWNEDKHNYSVNVEGKEYVISMQSIDNDNLYLIAENDGNSYTYTCNRLLSYLDMVKENSATDVTADDTMTLNEKLTIIIEDYVEIKTDGISIVNGVESNIFETKAQLQNALESDMDMSNEETTPTENAESTEPTVSE